MRTETVVCDTRDFGIGRRVTADNWRALRAVGNHANQRLCDAQAADARPAPDVVAFAEVTRPSTVDGQHAPGLRFGDPRVVAVMAAIVASPTCSPASTTPLSSGWSAPCSTGPTPAGRPPTTCAGSNAKD